VLGASVLIPIRHGRLALGTWQGIYLGEHRDHGGPRSVVVTVMGE
jgi:secondary thiamine-phosphate synthase enzyme